MLQKFRFKTLPMLVAAFTVADNFDAEKESFVAENPLWDDAFIAAFRAAIEAVLTEYYGINTKEELKAKTQLVSGLTEKAIADLKMVKVQIERGFRTDEERCHSLLSLLGFQSFWTTASRKNQSDLIGLLIAFRNNLTEALRAELEANGVNSTRLTNIVAYADSLNKANITQEGLKGSSKLETEKAVIALNDIYDRAMDICLVGQQLFRKDKLKKDLFVFSKLVKKQGGSGSTSTDTEEEPAE